MPILPLFASQDVVLDFSSQIVGIATLSATINITEISTTPELTIISNRIDRSFNKLVELTELMNTFPTRRSFLTKVNENDLQLQQLRADIESLISQAGIL